MSTTRIAFFADILVRDFDGAARTMYHIIDRRPREVEFLFVCGTGPVGADKEELNYITTATFTAPGNETYKISRPGPSKQDILAALREYKPDIIHIASPSLLGFFAIRCGEELGIPINTIYHTHFLSYVPYYLQKLQFLTGPATLLMRRLYLRFYNRCDRVMVPTATILQELEQIGVDADRLKIWARGIDTTIFSTYATDVDYLQGIVENTAPNLLFASRLVWEKNVKTLVDIHERIQQRGLGYNLLIVGDGVAKIELQKKMPHAIFLGEIGQSDLAKLYATVDAFVFTSISETFGNVVTEAMACGCPCIIANGGGTTAHIENGKSGYLVPPEDADAYLDRAQQLIEHESIRRAITDAGLRYTSQLSWEHLATTFFTNIADVIAQHSRIDG